MSEHSPLPWADAGEHPLTGYGDINHVLTAADETVIGALYANCFDAPHMRQLPSVAQAAANAALIVHSVNLLPELVAALEEIAALRPGVWMEAGISGDDCHKAPGIAAAILSKARAGASQSYSDR